MVPNNGGDNNNSRKRKMKEIALEPKSPNENNNNNNNLFMYVQPQQNLTSPNVTQVQHILNTAAPFRPFSFTSLITAPYHPIDDLDSDIKNQTQHINQIITHHSENLKHTLGGVLENHHHERNLVADGRVATKLKEKELEIHATRTRNAELGNMLEFYKGEADRLQGRVRSLERSAISLRRQIREANVARRYAEREEEDAESSFADPDRVEPVRLNCRNCEREVATMMMWPCRHVCVCARCDMMNRVCPVCHMPKTNSIEVFLPPN